MAGTVVTEVNIIFPQSKSNFDMQYPHKKKNLQTFLKMYAYISKTGFLDIKVLKFGLA